MTKDYLYFLFSAHFVSFSYFFVVVVVVQLEHEQ